MVAHNSKIEKIILKVTQKLFKDLGFETEPEVRLGKLFFNSEIEAPSDTGVTVAVPGHDLGLLIGFRGETLGSLQFILNLIVNKKIQESKKDSPWYHLNLDIGGWKQEKEELLLGIAKKAVSVSLSTGKPTTLPPMFSSERRTVHLYLSTQPKIEQSSEGIEPNRKIIIKPK